MNEKKNELIKYYQKMKQAYDIKVKSAFGNAEAMNNIIGSAQKICELDVLELLKKIPDEEEKKEEVKVESYAKPVETKATVTAVNASKYDYKYGSKK